MTRQLTAGLVAVAATLALGACSKVEVDTSLGDAEVAKLTEIKGTDLQRVTIPRDAAENLGIQVVAVGADGRRTMAPVAALIYTPDGRSWVYTSPEPLSFVRTEVEVARVEGDTALLSAGPPAGTRVVTTGAAEVYGAEFEVGH